MLYVKYSFYKVVGFSKFLKNVQNAIDMILIIVYILYAVNRFISPMSLPDEANTAPGPNSPSVYMGFNIVLNLVLCILIICKLMVLIRINQTMSQLAELLIVCIGDVVPFMIFFVIWILIFCVLYKVLGAQQGVE